MTRIRGSSPPPAPADRRPTTARRVGRPGPDPRRRAAGRRPTADAVFRRRSMHHRATRTACRGRGPRTAPSNQLPLRLDDRQPGGVGLLCGDTGTHSAGDEVGKCDRGARPKPKGARPEPVATPEARDTTTDLRALIGGVRQVHANVEVPDAAQEQTPAVGFDAHAASESEAGLGEHAEAYTERRRRQQHAPAASCSP